MAIGFWIVKGDKTTCGGTVLTGHPEGKKIGPNQNRQATVGCLVSCGKFPGKYSVAGGYPGEYIHGQLAASTIYSRSTCPCRAFFIPTHTFMRHGPYQAPQRVSAPAEPEQYAQVAKNAPLPPYLTGEKDDSGSAPDYPVLRNTQNFPDENLRGMLSQNNHDVMLITISEAFEVLQSWGWKETKTAWVETT